MEIITKKGPEVQGSPVGGSSGGPGSRVGVFGGSFDPIHRGHLHVAREAAQAFSLDQVVFVPAAAPPHKPGQVLTAGEHRLAMVRLAIADRPDFVATDLELRRSGPSYTIDTLLELPDALGLVEPRLHLLLGSDNLPDLPRWHRGTEILRLAQPVVLLREGDDADRMLAELRGTVEKTLVERIEAGLLRLPPEPGRATELRRRLKEGQAPGQSLPEAVEAYIREHRLYGSPA